MQKPILYIIIFLLSLASHFTLAKNNSIVDDIHLSKEILVGTTGDYPPFSILENGVLTGIDIDMAKELASSKGINVRFILTTWKTLMSDLKDNKFHIAMSGISITDARRKIASFSAPYIDNGKRVIARCSESNYYNTWSKVDNSKTRLIVNPGGTNDQYVKQHIKNAQVQIFPDNIKIFLEIMASRADVMITDAVEVYYQSKLSNGVLCPATLKKLSDGKIGILMQKDKQLNKYIQSWLTKFELNGKKEKLFSKYL